ncbi:MAG: trigger factor [Firmicutes bacterium]|jgi:trigger factor|nr:trigger factor [Bacillota bacterium]
MSFELLKKEGNKVSLKVTIPAEELTGAMKKAYAKNKGRFNIPGFRKGKVPMHMVEKMYGASVFYDDALNILLPEFYGKAIDELAIEPVDRPEIDIEQMEKGKEVIFTADVFVKPEVKLGQYKGLEVEKTIVEVTDEAVDAELEKNREMNARLINVEDRAIETGDTAYIDYMGFDGELQFEGGTAENFPLVIGSNQFIPGFEDQLIGKNAEEEFEVNVSFPEDYHATDLAGKPVVFKVKVNSVKRKELPELDDEFAKDTSEFETLAELKEDTKKKLVEENEKSAEAEVKNLVIEKVVEGIEVDLPEAMIESEIDNMVKDFDFQLRYQGLDIQKYFEYTNSKEEDLREQMKEEAEKRVKVQVAIEAIAKEESVTVTDEDLEEEIEKISKLQNTTVEEVKKLLKEENYEYIKENLVTQKTMDFLVENAKVK